MRKILFIIMLFISASVFGQDYLSHVYSDGLSLLLNRNLRNNLSLTSQTKFPDGSVVRVYQPEVDTKYDFVSHSVIIDSTGNIASVTSNFTAFWLELDDMYTFMLGMGQPSQGFRRITLINDDTWGSGIFALQHDQLGFRVYGFMNLGLRICTFRHMR